MTHHPIAPEHSTGPKQSAGTVRDKSSTFINDLRCIAFGAIMGLVFVAMVAS